MLRVRRLSASGVSNFVNFTRLSKRFYIILRKLEITVIDRVSHYLITYVIETMVCSFFDATNTVEGHEGSFHGRFHRWTAKTAAGEPRDTSSVCFFLQIARE